MRLKPYQILKFTSEHITALNLVLNEANPKFSSLLGQASKVLKFVNKAILLLALINSCQAKCQDSLQVGKKQGLKRYLKNLLLARLLVKISHYRG